MEDLKQQILNLMQNWFEKNYPIDCPSYKDELKQARELLDSIYILVKNYDEHTDSIIKRIKEEKGLPPICDNENHTSGITYI